MDILKKISLTLLAVFYSTFCMAQYKLGGATSLSSIHAPFKNGVSIYNVTEDARRGSAFAFEIMLARQSDKGFTHDIGLGFDKYQYRVNYSYEQLPPEYLITEKRELRFIYLASRIGYCVNLGRVVIHPVAGLCLQRIVRSLSRLNFYALGQQAYAVSDWIKYEKPLNYSFEAGVGLGLKTNNLLIELRPFYQKMLKEQENWRILEGWGLRLELRKF